MLNRLERDAVDADDVLIYQQVMLKLKSKHIGGALSKNNKSKFQHFAPPEWKSLVPVG